MTEWKSNTVKSATVTIFIAGDFSKIEDTCRKFCEKRFCVSIKKSHYVYTYGMETGAEITLINYPRFPLSKKDLEKEALALARLIAEQCSQGSYTVQGPENSLFFSRREF